MSSVGDDVSFIFDISTINTTDSDQNGFFESWEFQIDVDVPNNGTASTTIRVTDDEGNDYGTLGPFTFSGTLTSDNAIVGPFTDDQVAPDNPPESIRLGGLVKILMRIPYLVAFTSIGLMQTILSRPGK